MPTDPVIWAVIGLAMLAGLGFLGWFGRVVFDNPRGDFETGFAFAIGRLYVRVFHVLRVRGRKRVPRDLEPGPLIVVANHTAGVDPVLVQAACPFMIRWIMAQDMRMPALEWFWRFWEVLFVDRERNDGAAMRTAIKHLKAGGVIGIFPEGGLERPPHQVMPFQPGLGVLVRRSGARVLPVVIDGTPQVDPAWASLWRTSASTVHFYEPIDYSDSGMSAAEIAHDLRTKFVTWTGWPANDDPPDWHDEQTARYPGRPVRTG